MRTLRTAIAGILALLAVAPAAAQLPNIQDHAVWGRIGNAAADGGSGPSQVVPFTSLFAVAGIPSGPQTCSTSNWFNTLSAAGVLGCAQPSFADLTGSLPNSQMATMAANTTKCNATGGSAVPTDCTGSTMRTNLALVIGTNVEAWDTDLDCLAAISTTGTVKRTGSGTCSAGSVALSDLATGSQDTIIGYWGSTTASALAINNCSNALTYNTSTHTFGCNAVAGTGTVTSVTCNGGLTGGAITTTGTCAIDTAYGGAKLLNTLTAASSATLSDTSSLTSSFAEYTIVFENVLPATSLADCEIQVHSAASFPATSYLATELNFQASASVVTSVTTYIPCSGAAASSGPLNAGAGISGSITVYNPSQTSTPKQWIGQFSYPFTGPEVINVMSGGYWNGGNTAVDGFQVLFSSGNIASGVIKIYGRK